MKVKVIACIDSEGGIGKNNRLPWRLTEDMLFFKNSTIGNGKNAIVTGRHTFASFNYKPLKNRVNYILSNVISQHDILFDDTYVFNNFNNIFKHAESIGVETLWIIGGAKVYETFLMDHLDITSEIFITRLDVSFGCDSFFPTRFLNGLNSETLCKFNEDSVELEIKRYFKNKC